MDLKSLKAKGQTGLTANQQAAYFHARKRRRAREAASAAEFKVKGVVIGFRMVVSLTTN